jgi:starch phosphorylase
MRLCQEFLLGIGGVRMLRALGIAPTVWHANEGHSAFLTLERIRELIQKGSTHADACETIRQSTVFTTHTPVPAGHDVFPHYLMDRYFAGYWEQLGLSREDFLRLGDTPESQGQGFNMTALAIRMAAHVNGVSREHGQVSREMTSISRLASRLNKSDPQRDQWYPCADMDRTGTPPTIREASWPGMGGEM